MVSCSLLVLGTLIYWQTLSTGLNLVDPQIVQVLFHQPYAVLFLHRSFPPSLCCLLASVSLQASSTWLLCSFHTRAEHSQARQWYAWIATGGMQARQ